MAHNTKHESRVKDFLHSNNLNEHTLMQDNYTDRAILNRVRTNEIFDYFTPSDAGFWSALNSIVVRGKKLKPKHFVKLEQAMIRAQRLQSRNLRRLGYQNGAQAYADYKQKIDTILLK
jgi:hypothetical protein